MLKSTPHEWIEKYWGGIRKKRGWGVQASPRKADPYFFFKGFQLGVLKNTLEIDQPSQRFKPNFKLT